MREMKDSGIEWIGKIPKSWSLNRLKNICATSIKDGTHQTPTYTDEDKGVPFLSSKDVTKGYIEWKDIKYITPSLHKQLEKEIKPIKNDILLAKNGTTGVAAIVDTDNTFDIYVTLAVIRVNNKIAFPQYMLYVINSLICKNQFNERLVGIGVPNLHLNIIKNTKIILPFMREQHAIVDFLDSKCSEIDGLTADIQKQIDILKEYKKSVITQAVTKGLDPNVEMKNTASPYWNKIPKKWYLSDIKYIFKIVKRIAGKEGFDILSVTQKGLKIKDTSRNEGQIAENYKGYQFVYPGDFVMNHMDLLTGWVDLSKLFGVTSPDYRVFKLRDNVQNEAGYYKYVMQCCYSCRIFYSLGQGVSTLGRWRLQTSVFNNFLLPVPPTTEQKAIADFLDAKCADIDAAIAGKQKQLDVLKEYKKSLIYEYVTGKKEVPCRE